MPRALKFGVFAMASVIGLFLQGGQQHLMILMASVMIAVPLALVMGVWLMIGLLKDAEVPIPLETLFHGCLMAAACLLLSIASASLGRWLEVR